MKAAIESATISAAISICRLRLRRATSSLVRGTSAMGASCRLAGSTENMSEESRRREEGAGGGLGSSDATRRE